MLGLEFLVAFQIEIALQVAHRDDEAQLCSYAEDLGFEAADPVAGSGVA
jgi:hypothetical protein